ncbi:MAG: chemotaxis protein CheA [Ardenticatenales bacterium]|nr:chemotaxis protein CheA [Ardenticatenales bacterium]
MSNSDASDENPTFFAEFLDDFFAECDEHLSHIHHELLALEEAIGQPRIPRAQAEELLRHFHSLKGLCAMTGVKQGEQLAHEVESYLRALAQAEVTLTLAAMDLLVASTTLLEQSVEAFRTDAPPPDIAETVAQLAALLTEAPAPDLPAPAPLVPALSSLSEEERGKIARLQQEGRRVWYVEFIPSSELVERGINVNLIRERLTTLGELIWGAPRVLEKGSIAFEFLVASDTGEEQLAHWRADGVRYASYEGASTSLTRRQSNVLPAARGAAAPPPLTLTPSNIVRVDLGRLDEVMRMVGELVITRSRLQEQVKQLRGQLPPGEWRALYDLNHSLERQLRTLRTSVMRVRLVPIGELFSRMQFVVRDLARETGNRVVLRLTGQEAEIDKHIVERMMDPLLHLVRNAVSHGLESSEERLALGKPAEGTISLRADMAGDTVILEIEDDGRGIDAALVARRAQEVGVPAAMPLLEMLCQPGFSTREEADLASGRGMGMAVVKETIESLGGILSLDTERGRGTCFVIQLPITLAILEALVVGVGNETFALPLTSVREIIEINGRAITPLEGGELLSYRDGALPLLHLARLFALPSTGPRYVLVIGTERDAVGVVVERVLGQREIVVRSLTDPLVQVPGIAGATQLGDGRVILILDAVSLLRETKR